MDPLLSGPLGPHSGLTIRQLRIFASVARHLSFTAAAQELYITQPSVSAAIGQLERHLDTRLLVRTTRNVSLTTDGEIMRDLAERILWQVHSAELLMRQEDRSVNGSIFLGADSTCGTYVMPALLGAFKTRYPAVNVRVDVLNRPDLYKRTRAMAYDLAIVSGPLDPQERAQSTPFALHELVIVAPPDHPLAVSRDIPPRALSDETIILREAGSGIRLAFELAMAEAGASVEAALTLGSNEAVKQAVQHRLGIAPISRLAVADELDFGRLATLDVEVFPLVRQWHLIRNPDRDTALQRTLGSFLLENVRRIIDCPPDPDGEGEPIRERAANAT